jgi:hypothetical protein
MRKLALLILVLIIQSCGGSKSSVVLNLDTRDYYFVRTVGGTAEAGISETFWVKFENPQLQVESMRYADQSAAAQLQEGGYYTASFNAQKPMVDFRKLEIFGYLKGEDTQVHIELDSVRLKEQVFMPAAMPEQP